MQTCENNNNSNNNNKKNSMSCSRRGAFLFQGFLRSVHQSSGQSESEKTGGCQHDDRDAFPLEMLSDLTVITGLTYGLPKPV